MTDKMFAAVVLLVSLLVAIVGAAIMSIDEYRARRRVARWNAEHPEQPMEYR